MTLTNYYGVTTHEDAVKKLFKSVYLWMMVGLGISGFTAYFAASSPFFMNLLFGNPFTIWILIIIELGLVFAISAGINKMSIDTARILFIIFSFIDGLTLSSIFLIFTNTSIAEAFFISAAMFGVMSLYGYFTNADLSKIGNILFMGLIGLIIAIIANFFFKSSTLELWIDIFGVIIFTGLTAYDTQKLKQLAVALENESEKNIAKIAIIGALDLYLDFINLFIILLDFFGQRQR